MTFVVKHFRELTADELLDILALRVSVFVVEQLHAYQEVDAQDRTAWHVLNYADEATVSAFGSRQELISYSRFFSSATVVAHVEDLNGGTKQEGITALASVIGRVIVHRDHRGGGLGGGLMAASIAAVRGQLPAGPIYICAQVHLERFYHTMGFQTVSGVDMGYGIPHIYMRLD